MTFALKPRLSTVKRFLAVICCALAIVLLPPPLLSRAAEDPIWVSDFDKGRVVADQSGKDLLVLFTGHGWCVACEILEKEVLSQPEFFDATKDDFVLVELDENFGNSPEEKAREKRHRQLKETLLCEAVPTVVLADSTGRPYTIITGYEGQSPNQFLDLIRQGQQVKQTRDQHFSAASSTAGVDVIRELHNALQVVAPLLGSFDERSDDPILVFYETEVKRILDSNDASGQKIRQHYVERKNLRDKQATSRSVFEQLMPFRLSKDYQGAIRFIDQRMDSLDDEKAIWDLEVAKQTFLEWDRQYDNALANARKLLARDTTENERREYVLNREAFNLFNLKRFEAGCAHYDGRIESERDPQKRLDLIGWKSQLVAGHGTPQQRIGIHSEYRSAAEEDSDHWLTATALLADAHNRLGQHTSELDLLVEYLEKQDSPWIKLRLIDCYLALDDISNATKTIDRLDHDVRGMAKSSRQAEKERYEYFSEQIAQRRKTVSQ